MSGLRRRIGRSASSRHGGLQESQYEGASDDCSSVDSASDINEIQDYDARMARAPTGFGRRATGGERLGRIRAGMRALSRTILSPGPTGSQDSDSSYSSEDDSAYSSDLEDDNTRHPPSLVTTLGFRRRPDASDFPAPRRREARATLYDHNQGTDFADDGNTHDPFGDENVPSEEDQPHHQGRSARRPYIPTPEDYPSRSRRCSTVYEEDSDNDATEGISSGLSEDVRPGQDYGLCDGADVYLRQRRPR